MRRLGSEIPMRQITQRSETPHNMERVPVLIMVGGKDDSFWDCVQFGDEKGYGVTADM